MYEEEKPIYQETLESNTADDEAENDAEFVIKKIDD